MSQLPVGWYQTGCFQARALGFPPEIGPGPGFRYHTHRQGGDSGLVKCGFATANGVVCALTGNKLREACSTPQECARQRGWRIIP
eukprot:2026898-Rhodomonas_salina.1